MVATRDSLLASLSVALLRVDIALTLPQNIVFIVEYTGLNEVVHERTRCIRADIGAVAIDRENGLYQLRMRRLVCADLQLNGEVQFGNEALLPLFASANQSTSPQLKKSPRRHHHQLVLNHDEARHHAAIVMLLIHDASRSDGKAITQLSSNCLPLFFPSHAQATLFVRLRKRSAPLMRRPLSCTSGSSHAHDEINMNAIRTEILQSRHAQSRRFPLSSITPRLPRAPTAKTPLTWMPDMRGNKMMRATFDADRRFCHCNNGTTSVAGMNADKRLMDGL